MSLKDTVNKVVVYLPSVLQIAAVATQIAKVLPGAAQIVAGIELGIKIANGLANEVPQVIKTWESIQAAAAGGQPVSEDEWAGWVAQIEEAHTGFVAAVANRRAELANEQG